MAPTTTERAASPVLMLDVQAIEVGPRKRPLDPDGVKALAASMAVVGLLQPITVTSSHRLITGHHRLEAAKQLGWDTITALEQPDDAIAAELAEIDENLVRTPLRGL